MKVLLMCLFAAALALETPVDHNLHNHGYPYRSGVSYSLSAIFQNFSDKLQLHPNKRHVQIFDVFATVSDSLNDKHELVKLFDLRFDNKGTKLSIKALEAEPGRQEDMFVQLNRERKYYTWFNTDSEKQMLQETYYLSREQHNGKQYFYVLMDPYVANLDSHYDDFCVENHAELLAIFHSMAEILDALHRKNIIHCNVQLGSFLIKNDGLGYIITDFGLVDEKDTCKDIGQGFRLPQSALDVDFNKDLKLIKRQDVYALGMAFLELINKNSVDLKADKEVDPSQLTQEKLDLIFENYGCSDAPPRHVDSPVNNYLRTMNHVFMRQLRELISSMIVTDVKKIADAADVYNRMTYLTKLYTKMAEIDVEKECNGISANNCVRKALQLSLTKGTRRMI